MRSRFTPPDMTRLTGKDIPEEMRSAKSCKDVSEMFKGVDAEDGFEILAQNAMLERLEVKDDERAESVVTQYWSVSIMMRRLGDPSHGVIRLSSLTRYHDGDDSRSIVVEFIEDVLQALVAASELLGEEGDDDGD